jgi:glycosyl hydrolase family 2
MSKIPIDAVQVRVHSINPAKAEMWITVLPHWETPTIELRGKVTGPRNQFASTVEIAYPLRRIPKPPADIPGITASAIIPDPCLWEPEKPFLYQGSVELWDDGKLQDSVHVQHGLRTVRLGPHGLRLNNRDVPLRALMREPTADKDMLPLRQNGCNVLIVPSHAELLWAMADRLGFLVLGRVDSAALEGFAIIAGYPPLMTKYASSLGWLVSEALLDHDQDWWRTTCAKFKAGTLALLGMELTRVPQKSLPRQIDFIVCAEALLPSLSDVHRPKLVRVENLPPEATPAPGILGWIGE